MSFGTSLALLVAALVVLPVAAHLRRRGHPVRIEFPPTRYVASARPKARQRSSLQDKALFSLRALGVLGLALLGATPFVRCSTLTLPRPGGASIALAIVIDDSLSMRARTGGGASRWELARNGARDLLAQMRPGDTVCLVLAGSPARVALPATADHESARRVVEGLGPSDRGTDLSSAVEMARSILQPQPHRDKRTVVLSDLAGDSLPEGATPITAPLESIRAELNDCAVLSASATPDATVVEVSCTSPAAAGERRVELLATENAVSNPKKGAKLGSSPLTRTQGTQRIVIASTATPHARVRAILTGSDDIAEDDVATVAPLEQLRRMGVVAELDTARSATGGPGILEQALLALSEDTNPRPIAEVPGDYRDLVQFSGLFVEDPPGFPPESREALQRWLERGGVALLLLGPASARPSLGWNLQPILDGPVHWNEASAPNLDFSSLSWLGDEGASLANLGARGRAQLPEASSQILRTRARWQDGEAWIVERVVGKGLGIAVGLPASPELSDFALRPGFLALLDHVIQQAGQRTFSGHSLVGQPWQFAKGTVLQIVGPNGSLELKASGPSVTAEPSLAGRYELTTPSGVEARFTRIDPLELSRQSLALQGASGSPERNPKREYADASRYVALALLVVFAAEMLLRVRARWRALGSA